jgi:DNA-binding protein
MSLQKQAEELMAIANAIEKQAAEVTEFVCDKCNHTTTLAKINIARQTIASEVGENVTVSDIGVDDKVTCPAPGCEGVLAYQETEASAGYYYDPDKVAKHDESKEIPAEEAKETPEMQKKEKEEGTEKHEQPKEASVDYDAIDRYKKG